MPGKDPVHVDLVPLPVPPRRVALGEHLDHDRLVAGVPRGEQRIAVVGQHPLNPEPGELAGQGRH